VTRHLKWIVVAALLAGGALLAGSLLWPTDVPDDLARPDLDQRAFFTAGQLEKASDYEAFTRVNAVLSIVVLVAVLALYARHGERFTRESAAGRIGTGMLLAMLGFAFVWLAELPFGIAQLWWDRRHDVSDQGYLDWIVSSWLSLGGAFLFVSVAVVIAMALARPLRRLWWIPAAAVFAGLGLLFTFTAPFLVPDVHDVRDDRLAADAKRLAREQGVGDIPVRVEDVDQFTDEPNAFATGLGPTRRVILWNTILEPPFGDREVRVVIAHELAHHSRSHLWELSGWFAIAALPTAFLIALVVRRRGGMYEARAVPLALVAVVALQIALTPAQNAVSRRMEAEADWVALQSTRDPAAAIELHEELAQKSLSDPDPPGWAVALFGTHPAALERIEMAAAWRARYGRPGR
jgi:STE24 endopeptidase